MRCAALIVLAVVALVLSACAGRKAEPWTMPTYGKPAPRYTPIPPLGERESTGGRVFFVADLDPKEDAAAIALWKSPEIQAALDSVGGSRLLGRGIEDRVAWDVARPAMRSGVFAYVGGREFDREQPFTSASGFQDWIGRVRSGEIDEAYADSRLGEQGPTPDVSALQIHGLRMMRLGLYDRAMQSLKRAWEINDNVKEPLNASLVSQLHDLSLAHPPSRSLLRSLAQGQRDSWNSSTFDELRGPTHSARGRSAPPDASLLAMMRFADLCVMSDSLDELETRIRRCKDRSQDSGEREWLMGIASMASGVPGLQGQLSQSGMLGFSGRLMIEPSAEARREILRPLGFLLLSGASRESTLRQLEPDFRRAGTAAGVLWCQCQAAGRRDEARDILLMVVEHLDYPAAIEAFLTTGISCGFLPSLTDEWLVRTDFNAQRMKRLREGVELLRRQPLMPASAE